MKKIVRNSTHKSGRSYDCLIAENGGKKLKMTYDCCNTGERCTIEIFDGYRWNHILSILDMGIEPNKSAATVWDENKRKNRADELFKKAEIMCKAII